MVSVGTWTDPAGDAYEVVRRNDEWWYRSKGTKEWIKGRPPSMVPNAKHNEQPE